MTDHPPFQVPPSVANNGNLLLESIRDYVVATFGRVEQTQQSIAALSRDVSGLKAGIAAAITDFATLLGPLQAVISDPAAAAEIEVVIKNLGEVAKNLEHE